jgi:chemotaxis signal transduction protein
LDKSDFDKSTRIVVVRFEKELIGFVVDGISQVVRINRKMVEPTPPLVGAVGQEYILGICKYHERLLILLDIDRVVGESGDAGDSDLKKKFLGTKDKKGKKAPPPAVEAPVQKYSMADAVATPTFTLDDDEDDVNDVLNDAVEQSKVMDRTEASVTQKELNQALSIEDEIAAELAKREAETDELNKKKKVDVAPAPAPAPAKSGSIEDEIAAELAKREAETDELNQRRRAENGDAEKKNDIDSEDVVPEVVVTKVEAKEAEPQKQASLAELKEIAQRIINGDANEMDLDIKGEVGELIKLMVDIKARTDEIPHAVLNSQKSLPNMASALTDVNSTTEKAAMNLLQSSQKLSNFYKNLQSEIGQLEKMLVSKDNKSFEAQKDKISTIVGDAGDLGLHIMEALEFQDITEQKIRKVIKSIEEVGARFGTIIGILKSKDNKKDYDELLADLGFA